MTYISTLVKQAGAAPVNEWRDAVLDALASHAMDAPLTDTPREIVKKLIDMVSTMARDPAINAPAAKVPEVGEPSFESWYQGWVKQADGIGPKQAAREAYAAGAAQK